MYSILTMIAVTLMIPFTILNAFTSYLWYLPIAILGIISCGLAYKAVFNSEPDLLIPFMVFMICNALVNAIRVIIAFTDSDSSRIGVIVDIFAVPISFAFFYCTFEYYERSSKE
uniref:Uncharacterized protein n=1 Tax=Panagrolaimus sp. PS1159 TaxID=55785 RepID=A0AC35F9Z2_9BILA